MRRENLLWIYLLLAALLMGGTGYSQSAADYKMKIEKINKEMAKYMIEGNTEQNLALYTPDAISLPSYEPIHEGIEAIKKASEDMKNSGWKCTMFEPTTLKVIPSGNLITEIGTYKITMVMPDSKKMDDQGKYVTIWEKQSDGSLKVKVETWNTDNNPMSGMQSMGQAGADKKN